MVFLVKHRNGNRSHQSISSEFILTYGSVLETERKLEIGTKIEHVKVVEYRFVMIAVEATPT